MLDALYVGTVFSFCKPSHFPIHSFLIVLGRWSGGVGGKDRKLLFCFFVFKTFVSSLMSCPFLTEDISLSFKKSLFDELYFIGWMPSLLGFLLVVPQDSFWCISETEGSFCCCLDSCRLHWEEVG